MPPSDKLAVTRTRLWSLAHSCRRLVEESKNLMQLEPGAAPALHEVARHLTAAAQLLAHVLDGQGTRAAPEPARVAQIAQAMLRPPAPRSPPAATAPSAGGVLPEAALPGRDAAVQATPPAPPPQSLATTPPSPQHRLAMHSQSFFVPTADLVTSLCGGLKSGILYISTEGEDFTIEIHEGAIVHAHSDGAGPGERLGDILVERGVLTRDALAVLLAKESRSRIGARAIEQHLATRTDLLAALETQIRRLFQRLFAKRPKEFAFWEGPSILGEENLRLNSTMLLLEGARAADEQNRPDVP